MQPPYIYKRNRGVKTTHEVTDALMQLIEPLWNVSQYFIH